MQTHVPTQQGEQDVREVDLHEGKYMKAKQNALEPHCIISHYIMTYHMLPYLCFPRHKLGPLHHKSVHTIQPIAGNEVFDTQKGGPPDPPPPL